MPKARRSSQFLPKWSVSGKRFLSRCRLLQFFSRWRLLQFSNFPADIVPLDKRQPVSKRNIYQSSLALLFQLYWLLLDATILYWALVRHQLPFSQLLLLLLLPWLLLLLLAWQAALWLEQGPVSRRNIYQSSLCSQLNYCQESWIGVMFTVHIWQHVDNIGEENV